MKYKLSMVIPAHSIVINGGADNYEQTTVEINIQADNRTLAEAKAQRVIARMSHRKHAVQSHTLTEVN